MFLKSALHAAVLALPLSIPASTCLPFAVSLRAQSFEELSLKLEDKPDDPALLEACGLAALDEGHADLGTWYLMLAIDAGADDPGTVARVKAKLGGMDFPLAEGDKALDAYTQSLFRLSKSCASKKLYANAVDLLARCDGTRYEKSAQEQLQKLFSKKKALDALLASGIAVPIVAKKLGRPGEIAKLNKKHESWSDPHEVKGEFYTVKTNMDYEMAHAMVNAMDQINGFYRKVFNYKARGGGMRTCALKIYRTRAEFDKHEDVQPNVKGFFSPTENSVTAYDPRTESRPGTLADLWSTLFHEASHQFTRAVWPNPIPTWLNEGTASYFEGARIEAGGRVTFNLVPDSRLRSLVRLLKEGSPTVEQVITYNQPGSYPGEYYPFGWGLTYFLRNYEDENCERVYLPILEEFMLSYKSGGAHDLKERFTEYFVGKARQKDVKTYDELVARFANWINELSRVHYGGGEVVDELVARGRKQIENKQLDSAIESFKAALRKRPKDPVVQEELAKSYLLQKNKDAAMYFYRQIAVNGRGAQDSNSEAAKAQLAMGLTGMAKVDKVIAANLEAADAAYVDSTLAVAVQCKEAGLTRIAVKLLTQGLDALGGDERLAAMIAEMGAGLDLGRYRRIPVDEELTYWQMGDEFVRVNDSIEVQPTGLSLAFCTMDTPKRFRYEARVGVIKGGDLPFYGLIFGVNNASGMRLLAIAPSIGKSGIVEFIDNTPEFTRDLDLRENYDVDSATIALEIQPGRADFFFNGEPIGSIEGGEELVGGLGFFAQGAHLSWSDFKLKY